MILRVSPRIGLFLALLFGSAHTIPALPGPLFESRLDFANGSSSSISGSGPFFAVDDFDGDGDTDIAFGNSFVNTISVVLGNGDGTYSEPWIYGAGDNPHAIASGDLNGDGAPDLAVSNDYDYNIGLFLGNGDGSFQSMTTTGVGHRPGAVAVRDLDGDGSPDLVVGGYEAISVLLNNGDATFQQLPVMATGVSTGVLTMGDLDGDNHLDLVTVSIDGVFIYFGTGDGTFVPGGSYQAPIYPRNAAIGDLDGDGQPDLAVASSGDELSEIDGAVSVLLNAGDRTFSPGQSYPADAGLQWLTAGDLDLDGDLDLVMANDWNHEMAILEGNGNGHFEEAVVFSVGSCMNVAVVDSNGDSDGDIVTSGTRSFSVFLGSGGGFLHHAPNVLRDCPCRDAAIADLDGDGAPELIAANGTMNSVSVLPGMGDGTFGGAVEYPAGETVNGIEVADLNADGAPDIVTANSSSEDVSVLLGAGDGSFAAAQHYSTVDMAMDLAVGDLDGDEVPDLAVANIGPWPVNAAGFVTILKGAGDGSFEAMDYLGVSTGLASIALEDLDGDGDLDIVAVCLNGEGAAGKLFVFIADGGGAYQSAVPYECSETARDLGIGDFNEDGIPDLAVAAPNRDEGRAVDIFHGIGDGTFQWMETMEVSVAQAVCAADLNGDGYDDLALAGGWISEHVTVLLGSGDGSFSSDGLRYGVGDYPWAVEPGDLDGDGVTDLVTANRYGGVSVLCNLTGSTMLLAAGPGPGPANPPLVRLFPLHGNADPVLEFPAYGASGYGVNVCCGDVTGDGRPELLTGAGPGAIYGPHVRGFDAAGVPVPGLSFLAYGTHRFGVNVAAGDIDADGHDELITGAGPGAVFGPHVRAWNHDGSGAVSAIPAVSFFSYGTPKWGVNVACGDIDGDGFEEIVTGAGPGSVYGPHVRGWNHDGAGVAPIAGVSFMAYGTPQYGVIVSCGDVDGDGIDEIVTGPGPGPLFTAHVRGWNCDGGAASPVPGCSFFAWPVDTMRYGARVFADADLNRDGRDEMVVGAGPDPAATSPVRVFRYSGSGVNQWLALDAFPDLSHGATVAAGNLEAAPVP